MRIVRCEFLISKLLKKYLKTIKIQMKDIKGYSNGHHVRLNRNICRSKIVIENILNVYKNFNSIRLDFKQNQ